MRRFADSRGREWVAGALEEDTPRHHGRWYLVLRPADGKGTELLLPEIRWQSRHSAERTLKTMSEFELRRRLDIAARRGEAPGPARDPFGDWHAGGAGAKDGTGAG